MRRRGLHYGSPFALTRALIGTSMQVASAERPLRPTFDPRSISGTDDMLFLLTNRTRPTLGAAEFAELAALAKAFYAALPDGVRIHGEWAAADRSHNYSLLEAPDIETVRRIQAPFERFTETTIVPVITISGWTAT
jgi:hypothetical protein